MKRFILFCVLFCCASCSTKNSHTTIINNWINNHFNNAKYDIVEVSGLTPIIYSSQQRIEDLQPLVYSDEELKYAPESIKIRVEEIKCEIEELKSNRWEKVVGYSCICKFNILSPLGIKVDCEYVFKFDEMGNIMVVEDIINDVEIFNR